MRIRFAHGSLGIHTLKIVHLIDDSLTRIVNAALVLLFTVMAGLAATGVFLRFFFNSGTAWGDIAARTLVIWVGFLGAVLATRDDKHFHIDVLRRFLRPHHQLWFRSLSDLFSAVVCFFLGQASVTFVELDSGNKTFLDIPIPAVEIIVPIGFYLMTIQFGLRMIINLVDGFRATSASGEKENE